MKKCRCKIIKNAKKDSVYLSNKTKNIVNGYVDYAMKKNKSRIGGGI